MAAGVKGWNEDFLDAVLPFSERGDFRSREVVPGPDLGCCGGFCNDSGFASG